VLADLRAGDYGRQILLMESARALDPKFSGLLRRY
jgi:hypothetical protein